MAATDFEFDTLDVSTQLRRLLGAGRGKGLGAGLKDAGEHLEHDALFVPPTAPDSGTEHVTRTITTKSGGSKTLFKMGAQGKLRESSDVRYSTKKAGAWVAFSAPHAFLAHEGIAGGEVARKWTRPGSGPKFLESKLLMRRAQYLRDVANGMKVAMARVSKRAR